jgi:CRISPR-associated protein Csm5
MTMSNAPFLRYRLRIELLTPFHVGCGRTIEPYEYDLRKEGGDCWLVALDIAAVFADAAPAQRSRFEQFSERGDFAELRRWFQMNADPARHCHFRVRVAPSAFQEMLKYRYDPARLGEIHLFTRDTASGNPYLPGSSIKGAFRTAIVDAVAREPGKLDRLKVVARDCARDRRGGARFEAAVLGNERDGRPDLYHDPLRQVALSDAAVPAEACFIDRIRIVRAHGQDSGDPGGIVIYRDLAGPGLGGEPPAIVAELRIHRLLADRGRMGPDALPVPLDAETLCRSCNAFYRPRLEDELRRFGRDARLTERLRATAGELNDHDCLLRLGRHSHFECVTVGEPFHSGPGRGFGATRSYVAGQAQLGWLRVRFDAVE